MTSPSPRFFAGAAARSLLKSSTLARFPGVQNPLAVGGGSSLWAFYLSCQSCFARDIYTYAALGEDGSIFENLTKS